MIAVDEVDVGESWRSEQDGVACRSAGSGVRSGIARAQIGLGLDEASGENSVGRFAHQQFSEQGARDAARIAVEEG